MSRYKIPAAVGESEITEKKSRFIGVCAYCEDEEAAKAFIAGLRKKHREARHVCYAWRFGGGSAIGLSIKERAADDGEPQGTAGAPILAVLRGLDLTSVICAVVRYFGGTLLGTGGLTRAYGEAAKLAVAAAGITERVETIELSVTVAYPLEKTMRKLCAAYAAQAEYGEGVTLAITVPIEEAEALKARVIDAANGAAIFK